MAVIFAHLTPDEAAAYAKARLPYSAAGTWLTRGRYIATDNDQLQPGIAALGWTRLAIDLTDDQQILVTRVPDPPGPKATRAEVYAAIDSERAYQDRLWNKDTTASEGRHSPEEWLSYVRRYIRVAEEILATQPLQIAYPEAMHVFRKLGAMLVCAMEQHGAPRRDTSPVPPGPPAPLPYRGPKPVA